MNAKRNPSRGRSTQGKKTTGTSAKTTRPTTTSSSGPKRVIQTTGKPDKPVKKSFTPGNYRDKKPKGDPLPKMDDSSTRLNKYLSNAGICSRREADVLIATGVISVNGKIVTELGYKLKPGDSVHYDGQGVSAERKRYVLLNKPKDFITTMDDPWGRKTVMRLIANACKERVYPVGRLDRETTGLLLFTNDGDLAKKMTHPAYGVAKLYHVETDKPVKPEHLAQLLKGVELDDGIVKADKAEYAVGRPNNEIGIEIHSGKNRVVRRLFEKLGYNVVKLDRVMFAGLTKKDLPRGHYRHLTEKEVAFLRMN
jgi:23S rRNA pseudouridine2605 synthase